MFSSSNQIDPLFAVTRREIALIKVDLPAPFAPTTDTMVPRLTLIDTE